MHRRTLLNLLARYRPRDADDARTLERFTAFVETHADCFERSLEVGHITGAAWLVDASGERVLLTHHRKLGMWLQLGGHADGDPDPLRVAMCEAREESGIHTITPISRGIFDLDIHEIPPHGDVPAHLHYDVRFLLRVEGDDTYRVSDESVDLAWTPIDDVQGMDVDASILRMREKWLAIGPRRRGSRGVIARAEAPRLGRGVGS